MLFIRGSRIGAEFDCCFSCLQGSSLIPHMRATLKVSTVSNLLHFCSGQSLQNFSGVDTPLGVYAFCLNAPPQAWQVMKSKTLVTRIKEERESLKHSLARHLVVLDQDDGGGCFSRLFHVPR